MELSYMTMGLMLPYLNNKSASMELHREKFDFFLQKIKDSGYKLIDISTREIDEIGAEYIKECLLKHGIDVGCLIYFDRDMLVTNKKYTVSEELLAYIAELNVHTIMPVPRHNSESQRMKRADLLELLVDRLSVFVAAMYSIHVKTVIENRPDLLLPMCTSEDVTSILSKIPLLRLCYDTANVILTGEEPIEYYRKLKDRTEYFHLKDVAEVDINCNCGNIAENGKRLASVVHGTGLVDFKGLAKEIKAAKYNGVLTVEYMPGNSGDEKIEKTLESARMMFEELLNIG